MSKRFSDALLYGAVASFAGTSHAQTAPSPPIAATPSATPPSPAASSSPMPAFVQPETGVPVEFDSNALHISVFVAPGVVSDSERTFPDPFVKLGRTPFSIKLASGTYTMSVESPDISTASTVFEVGSQPVHVRVKGGGAEARGLGTLLIAVGAAGTLTAIAIEASYSEKPDGFSKSKIAIPLFIVGGVGLAAGLTVYFTSGTTIEQDGLKTDRRGAFIGVTSRW